MSFLLSTTSKAYKTQKTLKKTPNLPIIYGRFLLLIMRPMFYDLDDHTKEHDGIRFTMDGIRYEIGEISEKYTQRIQKIGKGNVLEEWRPIVRDILADWNDTTPEITDELVYTLLPLIKLRIYANNKHI